MHLVTSRSDPGEVMLPQTLAVSDRDVLPAVRDLKLDDQRTAIQNRVKEIARDIANRPDTSSFECNPLSSPAAKMAGVRRSSGFELIDANAEVHGDFGSESIASVCFVKAANHRDLIIPIIIPHERADDWGSKIRDQVYRDYQLRYGETPLEMAKSLTRKSIGRLADKLCKNAGAIACTGLLVISATAVTVFGPALERVMHFSPANPRLLRGVV